MKKQFAFVSLLIAMVVLTLMPISLVRAINIRLKPISGSDCDTTTFEYHDHVLAEGFAVSISADIPFDAITQIRFGCAVAGLGDPWIEGGGGAWAKFTPYVKEMWVKVEGGPDYETYTGSISDNTGTGADDSNDYGIILNTLELIFFAWDIYDWLQEIYEEPPDKEFQPEDPGGWVKAITRQTIPIVDSDEPRLQTAGANVLGYFEEGCSRILTVTAQAEIYYQIYDIINNVVSHGYIGTYSVSFEVSVDPVCAMKTRTDGYFYVPNVASDLLKIEMLFDNPDIVGDQRGGTSPYSTIQAYPDGKVDLRDTYFISMHYGKDEGMPGWNYMTDLNSDGKCDLIDCFIVDMNYGAFGTYITDLSGVTVTFNTGEEIESDANGYLAIPQDATSFTVKQDGNLIGAMVIFW